MFFRSENVAQVLDPPVGCGRTSWAGAAARSVDPESQARLYCVMYTCVCVCVRDVYILWRVVWCLLMGWMVQVHA